MIKKYNNQSQITMFNNLKDRSNKNYNKIKNIDTAIERIKESF